jgi:nucleoside 2-deoxyribosyltransferase
MKIYFAGSIRGGRDDQEIYFSIIKKIGDFGEVLTEHIGKKELTNNGETTLSDKEIFERDMNWIKESDIVIAEVTVPSLGVGYELGQAESMNKKIICLYREIENKRLSAMISGNQYMKIFKYATLEDVDKILSENL